jgi:hypothetical protein
MPAQPLVRHFIAGKAARHSIAGPHLRLLLVAAIASVARTRLAMALRSARVAADVLTRARLFASMPLASTGVYEFSLQDTDRATVIIANVWEMLTPPLFHMLLVVAPLLGLGWALASGLGRSYVLRRYDPTLPFRPATLIVLQYCASSLSASASSDGSGPFSGPPTQPCIR